MRIGVPGQGRKPTAAGLLAMILAVSAVTACSGSATSFSSMLVPESHTAPILGPISGTGTRTFTTTGHHLMSYQIGCLGHHVIRLRAPYVGIAVQCANGEGYVRDSVATPRREIGARISIRVVAPSGTAWRLRVDGSRR